MRYFVQVLYSKELWPPQEWKRPNIISGHNGKSESLSSIVGVTRENEPWIHALRLSLSIQKFVFMKEVLNQILHVEMDGYLEKIKVLHTVLFPLVWSLSIRNIDVEVFIRATSDSIEVCEIWLTQLLNNGILVSVPNVVVELWQVEVFENNLLLVWDCRMYLSSLLNFFHTLFFSDKGFVFNDLERLIL